MKLPISLKKISLLHLALIVLNFTNCSKLTEYSPYDLDITDKNVNISHLNEINKTYVPDTLKFAVFADSHSYYDDLADAITSINQQQGIQFVVCLGDVTEAGLAREYNWYLDLIKNLKYPIITVIGNHDYLSNGFLIYTKLFGPSNFSFTCNSYKFVIFDDIVWENNNKSPKFDWLKTELESDLSVKKILLAHIPPWTDQLEGIYALTFENIVANSNVILCLHGHLHNYEEKEFASVPAIVSGSVKFRTYNIISLYDNKYSIKQIYF